MKRIRFAVVFGALVLVMILTACDTKPENETTPILPYKIVFPVEATPTLSKSTIKTYDMNDLASKLEGEKAYIYSNPQMTDYSIVTELGFDVNHGSIDPDDPEVRWYQSGSRELRIDQYGAFAYWTDVPDTWFEVPFSDKEAGRIAKDYLDQYDLWRDDFIDFSMGYTTNLNAAEGEKIVAKHVCFYQEIDGKDVTGTNRVIVEINGNGEVVHVNYSIRLYQNRQEVELISIEDAIAKIDSPGEAFIGVQSTSRELVFEDVVIEYWSETLEYDFVVMQPVYRFIGTSITNKGEQESFSITVQANVVNAE